MRLDPSLGVNRMSTKRNDYAPKNECVDLFFNICPKQAMLKKISFDHSFIFSCLHLLSLKKTFHLTLFLYHGPLHFFLLLKHLFCLTHRKIHWTMSMQALKYVFRGPQTPNGNRMLTNRNDHAPKNECFIYAPNRQC